MTPYERGYAAGLKAASEVCKSYAKGRNAIAADPNERRRIRNSATTLALAAEYCANEILSLPIEGEATNPGEQVAYPVRDGSKHLPEVSLDLTPARPGPSQECVMVPLLAWEYAITRLRGLHGLRLEGEPKPIDNAHFFKLLAAREE